MGSLQGDIEASLSELRRLTATDFAALAWADDKDQAIRWKYASGSRNERYKRIVLRLGKGIAGKVLRSGRPMIMESFSPQSGDDPREYPILLAENLKSIVSVPVVTNDRIKGVLLVGCRHTRGFDEETVELVSVVAEQLGTMIQQRGGNNNGTVRTIAFYSDLGDHKGM
ncbi:GAF domain-containing protein [Effusibacillus lacus]|uniref:GAF domain-containing protein n=1 Tax=Effusibacillus lacus TaxID=1348429 RepID=A0A292YSE6_9BACL|nr:GAF domain-containing protein [Effusibacillus lacus]TCS76079.1 nitrogen regulatory protein A [Effusibacillus lacus]GAX91405.1 GAF domain-containing protein [Effusibacillus lacus]